jgi:hypothetical protein
LRGPPAALLRDLFHDLHLDLLDLEEPLPLVGEQEVELGVEVSDLQLGLQVHAVAFGFLSCLQT